MRSHTSHDNYRPMILREADDFIDMESMRVVRNEVRGKMTHNTAAISRQQQIDWYRDIYLPNRQRRTMFGFIVELGYDCEPVGYGLITEREGKYWVSGGLTRDVRGFGLGKNLFSFMTNYIHHELDQSEAWLDVREDNTIAQSLYTNLGYTALGNQAGIVLMKHNLEVPRVQ